MVAVVVDFPESGTRNGLLALLANVVGVVPAPDNVVDDKDDTKVEADLDFARNRGASNPVFPV